MQELASFLICTAAGVRPGLTLHLDSAGISMPHGYTQDRACLLLCHRGMLEPVDPVTYTACNVGCASHATTLHR